MCRSIVLAVDIEPAGRAELAVAGDPGLRLTLERLLPLREQIEQRTGHPPRFHWFLRGDAQIDETWGPDWLPRACPDLIGHIARFQDGTGIHPHFWRRHQPSGTWSNDPGDPEWINHCIELCYRHHQHVFGSPPRASRMGDRWISSEVLSVLRRLGIEYDLSVEPGLAGMPFWGDPHATAALPDMRHAPRHPYPVADDPFRAAPLPAADASPRAPKDGAERGVLWMVPVSTTYPRLVLCHRYPFFERVSWPAILVMRPQQTRAHLERELSRETTEPLVLPLRTGDLANPKRMEAFNFVVEGILGHPRFPEARFVPVEVAMRQYLQHLPTPEPAEVPIG